jgi:hypothetical protein
MSKFKVGDKVIIIGNHLSNNSKAYDQSIIGTNAVICRNEGCGDYDYGVVLDDYNRGIDVNMMGYDLEFAEKTWDNITVGDYITYSNYFMRVLRVCGEIIFTTSLRYTKEQADGDMSTSQFQKQYLKENNYKIVQDNKTK